MSSPKTDADDAVLDVYGHVWLVEADLTVAVAAVVDHK